MKNFSELQQDEVKLFTSESQGSERGDRSKILMFMPHVSPRYIIQLYKLLVFAAAVSVSRLNRRNGKQKRCCIKVMTERAASQGPIGWGIGGGTWLRKARDHSSKSLPVRMWGGQSLVLNGHNTYQMSSSLLPWHWPLALSWHLPRRTRKGENPAALSQTLG